MIDLLRTVGDDAASRDRIALASTFSHGESAWVGECAWHAAHADRAVRREATVGGVSRVDLQIDDIAVEFKATHAAWALKAGKDQERELWLGRDVDKLKVSSAPALAVVTVVALTPDVKHQQRGFHVGADASHLGSAVAADVLSVGITAVQRVLNPRCLSTAVVALPPGQVPRSGKDVLLAAVVGAVNEQALERR